MTCQFCQYDFDESCGIYGCPNCNGEGLEMTEQQKFNEQADHFASFVAGLLLGAVLVMSLSVLVGQA